MSYSLPKIILLRYFFGCVLVTAPYGGVLDSAKVDKLFLRSPANPTTFLWILLRNVFLLNLRLELMCT
jgi:hypothetical protein